MTEVERIVANGILPKSFFDQEVRDGFLVTKKRKKLWAIQIDLLIRFDQVCKKHGLSYFLNSGTLLGAIRHKGFIPWDDDVDVEMPREDYDKLMQFSSEFEFPYFLQTPHTDIESGYSFAKLRNSNTTMASKPFAFQDMNQGVWIDIFPYDKWSVDDKETYDVIKFFASENSLYMRKKNPRLKKDEQERVDKWLGIEPTQCYDIIHTIAQKYRNVKTDYLNLVVCTLKEYGKHVNKAIDYSDALMADFEGKSFPVPIGYDNILQGLYGNYMEYPPIEKRGVWHDNLLIDVDIPFNDYLMKYRETV